MSFQAAIHLVKDATESIVTKVEEVAVQAVVSSILGTDERLMENLSPKETKHEETKKEETKKEEELKPEVGKAEIVPEPKDTSKEELNYLREELHSWKLKYNEALSDGRSAREELDGYQERLALLSHKLSHIQEAAREDVLQLTKQINELNALLEEERRVYGKEIIALTDQLLQERQKNSNERLSLNIEVDALRARVRELEDLLSQVQLNKEDELPQKEEEKEESKETFEEKLNYFEHLTEQTPSEEKPSWESNISREVPVVEKPKEQEQFNDVGFEGLQQTGSESKQVEAISEPSEIFSKEESTIEQPLEQSSKLEENDSFENVQPEQHEEERPLSNEEIMAKIQAHRSETGKMPAPAVRAGGKRIKQNPSGPHITHKTTLVEKRDEKRLEERLGESAEQTSKELSKIDQEAQLSAQHTEQLAKRAYTERPEHILHKAAFPSTYFPPEAKHDYQKKQPIILKQYQNPMHGHKISQ